jgi:hypothetical protein
VLLFGDVDAPLAEAERNHVYEPVLAVEASTSQYVVAAVKPVTGSGYTVNVLVLPFAVDKYAYSAVSVTLPRAAPVGAPALFAYRLRVVCVSDAPVVVVVLIGARM